jgi:1,4-dihydroxy-2-naphthoate octaprenyltransferase
MVIDTLLCINNFRDRHNDARDGKRTLIVRLGENRGAQLYNIIGLVGACITMVTIMQECRHGQLGAAVIIPYLFYAYKHSQSFDKLKKIWNGKALNEVLGMTARDMFIYGLMTVVAIFISSL